MEGIILCGVVLAAIVFLRSQDQETRTGAYAAVRNDSNDDSAADAFTATSTCLLEHSPLSSDDDWPTNNATYDSTISSSYDPMYAYEPDNIYHGTVIDPTHHDDDWSSSTSSFDDSFSSSSSDDSWSSSSSTDSLSSCSSFDD